MPLTIGQLARETGVTMDTIRFYERKALLLAADRTVANYRTYSNESLRRLKFIRKAQALGFTLEEISELLAFGSSPESTAGDVFVATERKINEQRNKIEQLSRLREVLIELAAECDGKGPTEECPILNYVFDEDGNRLPDGHGEKIELPRRQRQ